VNTPSHAILNLALLMEQQGAQATLPIVSVVLPDLPMFALLLGKFISTTRKPNLVGTYYEPFWQNITDTFHSTLALIGLLPTTGSGKG